ncbi:MAG: serine/threonine-protein kinase [Myxococcota bacterium]
MRPSLHFDRGYALDRGLYVDRKLGEGAMGSVWKARDERLGTVAVKLLQPTSSEEISLDELEARFEREAKVTSAIEHPHVVRTLRHGVTPRGEPYLVLEYLEGESLEERLEREVPLPIDEARTIVRQVAEALAAAHAQGIIHRDLKPGNVFLATIPRPTVKVLDFGLAKRLQPDQRALTGAISRLGTAHYMSPEQIMSARSVDHRADLWSLAVLAYKMVTGHFPFDGETLGAIAVAVAVGEFRPASSYRPEAGTEVDAVFARALSAADMSVRYTSALEFAAAFDAALRPFGARVRAERRARLEAKAQRRRLLGALALLGGMLVVLVPLAIWLLATRGR